MNSFSVKAAVLSCAVALAFLFPSRAADQTTDQGQVVEAVRAMYAALAADDAAKFRAVTAKDFYAFDGGERFDGNSLLALIKEAHAGGKVFVWNVTEPAVQVRGETAWITYVNDGSINDSSGTKKVIWLESAVLHKENGSWRVQFLHSTRASKS